MVPESSGPREAASRNGRPLRSDARRNRARILDAAFTTFAREGLGVPVHEIARRAGVGTGTVSRHFPTKVSLYQAILVTRAERLVADAHRLAAEGDPSRAFFGFLSLLIAEGAANRAIAEAIAGTGFDLETSTSDDGIDLMGTLRDLLLQAQRTGSVRADVDVADVKALLTACHLRGDGGDDRARERMIAIVRQGLRPGS